MAQKRPTHAIRTYPVMDDGGEGDGKGRRQGDKEQGKAGRDMAVPARSWCKGGSDELPKKLHPQSICLDERRGRGGDCASRTSE
jgi:hypothetical protein